jgi:hypothetical protein
MNHFDCDSINYFGVKVARGKPSKALPRMTLFQVFRRSLAAGVVQGVSFVQIGKRHLVYLGSENGSLRIAVGFLWLTRATS